MFLFGRREPDESVPIEDTVRTFLDLVKPLVDKGDLAGVQNVYSLLYADLLKKAGGRPLEQLKTKQAMEEALEQALTRPVRERRRFFAVYRASWWRRNE